jgi:hypothetical protein
MALLKSGDNGNVDAMEELWLAKGGNRLRKQWVYLTAKRLMQVQYSRKVMFS